MIETAPINWFPGHMAKAIREVKQRISQVELIIEIRDARLPFTSSNPEFKKFVKDKQSLVIFNKSNLSDPLCNEAWKKKLQKEEVPFLFVNILDSKQSQKIVTKASDLMEKYKNRYLKKGITPPPIRAMVLGLPNTGKSTFINRFTHKSIANTGPRPGVTQHQQWISLKKDFDLLDTPGIMIPKINQLSDGFKLSCIHAIKDQIAGPENIVLFLIEFLLHKYPSLLSHFYSIECNDVSPMEICLQIGKKRNLLKKGGEVDLDKTYATILLDFRKGNIGRVSFEWPKE